MEQNLPKSLPNSVCFAQYPNLSIILYIVSKKLLQNAFESLKIFVKFGLISEVVLLQ